jgi:hypothetical protein
VDTSFFLKTEALEKKDGGNDEGMVTEKGCRSLSHSLFI